jgi:hypothetical protein
MEIPLSVDFFTVGMHLSNHKKRMNKYGQNHALTLHILKGVSITMI